MSENGIFFEVKEEPCFEEKIVDEHSYEDYTEPDADEEDRFETCCLCPEGTRLQNVLIHHLQTDHSGKQLIQITKIILQQI